MRHPFLLAVLLVSLTLVGPSLLRAEFVPDQPLSGYKHRWALIVGIDYKDVPGDHQLSGAENDATAVRDLLSQNYGYDKDHIVLLTGKDATFDSILFKLAKGLLDGKDVGKDDSILFYFAGHGYLHAGEDGKAEKVVILPADVQFDADNKALPVGKVLRLNEDVVTLMRESRARHKLLILDCCHAGGVFQVGGQPAGKAENDSSDDDLFRTPAFQAITACRAKQYAQDQAIDLEGHSPFAYALLKALRTIPLQQREGQAFTANHLFDALKYYFHDLSSNKNQSPQCKSIEGPQGEFHFFPSGPFKDEAFENESTRRMLVAMVPGAFGNWWFDETPWMMPSLRLKILTSGGLSSFRSLTSDEISKEQLRKAALEVLEHYKGVKDPDPLLASRLKHLCRLLGQGKKEDPKKVLREVADELKASTEKAGVDADPTDLHYLAVLLHGQGDLEGTANEAYDDAVRRYRECVATDPTLKPLLALCLTDRAWYELNVKSKFEESARDFAEAHRLVEAAPPPFLIFTLLYESDSWLRLGRWGQAQAKMRQALDIATRVDKDGDSPLTAAVHSRIAWSYMERWLIHKAEEEFRCSDQVLEKLRKEKEQDGGQLDVNAEILEFHNAHGLALARRFLGEPEEALRQYHVLVQRIRRRAQALQEETGMVQDCMETRGRLIERMVNSLERQADCNLFADPPDLAEAADDYRRALRICPLLSPDREAAASVSLLYKQAVALTLTSPVQDKEAARDLVRLAGKKARDFGFKDPVACGGAPVGEAPKDANLKDQSDRIKFLAVLADALIGYSCDSSKTEALQRLRTMIAKRSADLGANISRDDLESLLFAAKVLVQQQSPALAVAGPVKDGESGKRDLSDGSPGVTERFQRMMDVELLLGFCRKALRRPDQAKNADPGPGDACFYLRQYYDAAVLAMLESNPKGVKPIIEAVYEATEGKSYVKPIESAPILALYVVDGKCHLFLDVPHGVSKHYVTDEDVTLEQVLDASRTKQTLDLPSALRKDLLHVPDMVCVRWKDPLRHLGDGVHVSGSITHDGPEVAPDDAKKADFPFNLRGIKVVGGDPAAVAAKAEPK